MRNSVMLLAVCAFCSLAPLLSPSDRLAGDQQVVKAVAVLHPTAGNKVIGIVTFTKVRTGIEVVADLEGLTPGLHGFHIHQYGDCSAPNGDSAGGHFNPEGMPHGAPTSKERRVGDFGNVTADKDGKAHLDWTDPLISLRGAIPS